MNIARNFIVIGSIYLIVGITLGMYMGGAGDHTLAPLHAHINLLGFTLMTVFGVLYRIFPAMAENTLAKVHFWGHLIGGIILVGGLYVLLTNPEAESSMAPVMIISELLVFLSVLAYAWNAYKTID